MTDRRVRAWFKTHFGFLWYLRSAPAPAIGQPVTGWTPPSAATPADPYPSLGVIEGELCRVELGNQQRAQGVDTKAGVIVGAAGVIVTLGATSNPSVAVVVGLFLAAIGGGFAVWAFQPRSGSEISPQALVDRGYLSTSELQSRISLLATRAEALVSDEVGLVAKANRLKAATLALMIAIAVILVGLIMNVS